MVLTHSILNGCGTSIFNLCFYLEYMAGPKRAYFLKIKWSSVSACMWSVIVQCATEFILLAFKPKLVRFLNNKSCFLFWDYCSMNSWTLSYSPLEMYGIWFRHEYDLHAEYKKHRFFVNSKSLLIVDNEFGLFICKYYNIFVKVIFSMY